MSIFHEIATQILKKKNMIRYDFCRSTRMDVPALYQWFSGKRTLREPNLQNLLQEMVRMNGKPITFYLDKEGSLKADL